MFPAKSVRGQNGCAHGFSPFFFRYIPYVPLVDEWRYRRNTKHVLAAHKVASDLGHGFSFRALMAAAQIPATNAGRASQIEFNLAASVSHTFAHAAISCAITQSINSRSARDGAKP
jgi:hypothetical protein